MKLFSRLLCAKNLYLRLFTFFLAVIFVAFVYCNDVLAANTYTMYKRFNNMIPTAANKAKVFVVGENRVFSNGTWQDGSNHDFIGEQYKTLFDLVIPLNYYLNNKSGYYSLRFSDQVNFQLSLDAGDAKFCQFIDAYVESSTFSSGFYRSGDLNMTQFGAVCNNNTEYPFSFLVNYRGLPVFDGTSATVYLHLLFSTTKGSNYGSSLVVDSQPVTFSFYFVPSQFTITDDAFVSSNSEVGKLQDIEDTIKHEHQEEIDKGDSSGSDASGMVDDITSQVKSKWEILFYPIEFTKKFLALFTSGSGSTGITFPAFSLEVNGSTYQVWDSYTFDLASLESDFSILFTGLHMVVGTIEVSAFIKYLYNKYDEVFGGGS